VHKKEDVYILTHPLSYSIDQIFYKTHQDSFGYLTML